jgi:hypothetical protein
MHTLQQGSSHPPRGLRATTTASLPLAPRCPRCPRCPRWRQVLRPSPHVGMLVSRVRTGIHAYIRCFHACMFVRWMSNMIGALSPLDALDEEVSPNTIMLCIYICICIYVYRVQYCVYPMYNMYDAICWIVGHAYLCMSNRRPHPPSPTIPNPVINNLTQ